MKQDSKRDSKRDSKQAPKQRERRPITKQAALDYHALPIPGKVDVQSSKPCDSEDLLSLAYSPGVAEPCKAIAAKPELAYQYTTKGNLVAVISNGSAVLGLGNIGPLASKPVMEGKGVLFKQFAGINVFDIEINANTVEEMVNAIKPLEPTFGGINLEDIKAPECFLVEDALKKSMNIPVFHDDQHGTAIITGAALLNACLITKRKLEQVKVVFNGAGAASIACARLIQKLGVQRKNIILCDSQGVVYEGRTEGMNPYKQEFANDTKTRNLGQALDGADVFIGLSVAGAVTKAMLKGMAKNPIIFAMANPDPEISPIVAKEVRPDCIVATGRSDFPNQVNNVLGFPSIFRGALDTHATAITEEMKLAAVRALAELAQEEVPDSVARAYGNEQFHFGPDYIIPKPFDPRVLQKVAPAVARAAMDSGVARIKIKDFEAYKEKLEAMQSRRQGFIRSAINKVKQNAAKSKSALPIIMFPEARNSRILKAIQSLLHEKICQPVLLGYEQAVKEKIVELDLPDLLELPIIHPSRHSKYPEYVAKMHEMRSRKGVTKDEAERLMSDPYYFAAMAVQMGDAQGQVSGASQAYAKAIIPILEIIGTGPRKTASGLNMVLFEDRVIFFADTTVNVDPTAEQLATIALHASRVARYFDIQPKVAMLSFSNFTARLENPRKMRQAVKILKELDPTIIADGEMQADTAVNPKIMQRIFPFSEIKDGANILVFPNLDAGNISYKLVQQLGGGEVLGPFLMGVNKPANVLQRTCTVDDIINTIVLTALECQVYEQSPQAKKSKAKSSLKSKIRSKRKVAKKSK